MAPEDSPEDQMTPEEHEEAMREWEREAMREQEARQRRDEDFHNEMMRDAYGP